MTAAITRHRFTVEEYYRLAEIGILHEDSKVELIRGTIYNKFPPEGGDVRPYRFTRDAVARMVAAGLLTGANDPGDFVDTTDGGEDVAAMNIRHQMCVIRLNTLLLAIVPAGFLVSPQNPIRLTIDGEPEPDFAVIYDREYDDTPTEADTPLIVEVSDATIGSDRRVKLPLYAEAGIAEVWLVDVNTKAIERHTEPHDGRFGEIMTARPGETLASTTVPGVVIGVAEVFR